MRPRTLLIALTVAAVATTLGYGLLGLAAPGDAATATLATPSIDVDALIDSLSDAGTARVIVLEESPPAPTPAWSDEDDEDDDRDEDHDDDDDHDDEDDEDDEDDDDRRRGDRDDDD